MGVYSTAVQMLTQCRITDAHLLLFTNYTPQYQTLHTGLSEWYGIPRYMRCCFWDCIIIEKNILFNPVLGTHSYCHSYCHSLRQQCQHVLGWNVTSELTPCWELTATANSTLFVSNVNTASCEMRSGTETVTKTWHILRHSTWNKQTRVSRLPVGIGIKKTVHTIINSIQNFLSSIKFFAKMNHKRNKYNLYFKYLRW